MSIHQDQVNQQAKSRLSEWQIDGIVNCHRAGIKENVICKTMNLSPSTVSTVIKRAGSKGTGLLRKRSGAPLKMDNRDQRRLARQLRSAPLLPMKNHLKLWCDADPSISMDTFRKYMKLIGSQSYKTVHKPALTPEHKLKRLSWCLDKVGWGQNSGERLFGPMSPNSWFSVMMVALG
ncbi:uncharacterized protein ATC70_001973 [Mucor velutinosus]|uniref:Transposase Tc1-like domain-containing protein n=1 Tax=Mucor velutinosus TaxID=708070 RepID=A0AAN7DH28_9FUNG|nr:hypothetical protein ATC70_001973 [Mucor velutinosus]